MMEKKGKDYMKKLFLIVNIAIVMLVLSTATAVCVNRPVMDGPPGMVDKIFINNTEIKLNTVIDSLKSKIDDKELSPDSIKLLSSAIKIIAIEVERAKMLGNMFLNREHLRNAHQDPYIASVVYDYADMSYGKMRTATSSLKSLKKRLAKVAQLKDVSDDLSKVILIFEKSSFNYKQTKKSAEYFMQYRRRY